MSPTEVVSDSSPPSCPPPLPCAAAVATTDAAAPSIRTTLATTTTKLRTNIVIISMTLINKLTRALRWLRWSTVCAILFYMFFIGLILHSTTYKLQHALKSGHQSENQHYQPLQQQQHQHQASSQAQLQKPFEKVEHHLSSSLYPQQETSSATGNNVLHAPEDTSLIASAAVAAIPAAAAADSSTKFVSSSPLLSLSSLLAPGNTKSEAFEFKLLPAPSQVLSSSSSSAILSKKGKATLTQQQQKHEDKQKQNKKKIPVEPETVILAAGSVNEKKILEKAFRRADKNHDNLLTIQELAFYINKRIIDHINEAIDLNPREFKRVDISPADGVVTWEEYHKFFLKSHDLTEDDLDERGEIKRTSLNRKAREDMARDQARWSEAARTDIFSLTIDEYLSFRHPESSVSNLLELVDDLLRQFDQDGDDQLTIEEFSEVSVDDDDDLMRKSLISKTVVERKEEFKRIIDRNADGKADRGELLNYVNPKTPRYALQEAATLFSLCDENHDGKLTLKEMTSNAEIFLTSKMIDTANSFHTEF